LGLVVMVISAGANVWVSRRLFRVAKETNSMALEADAQHLSVDVYTSLGVFGGLVLIQLTHWKPLDGIVALCLALAIGKISWDLTHRAAEPLLDKRLPEAEEQDMVNTIREDPRVVDCHSVRSRSAGAWAYLDAHVTVAAGMSLEEADALEDALRERLQQRYKRLDVMLHVEPERAAAQPKKNVGAKQS
ncbi:MAG TPA: cation diffusion facilitator family transporter, partial [Armatimonadota bacterium]|nr:cation diffusion facilitator family transporter [Armatimonadota bacterium]